MKILVRNPARFHLNNNLSPQEMQLDLHFLTVKYNYKIKNKKKTVPISKAELMAEA